MSKSKRHKPRKLRNDFARLIASAFLAHNIGNLNLLRACIASGVNPDSPERDNANRTLLFNRDLPGDVAKVLLDAKANPRARDDLGFTPLHNASTGAARHLLAHGADIEAKEPVFDGTPLLTQAALGRASMVEFLLAHGANVDAETNRGDTALAVAERVGHADVCEAIRRHQAAKRRPVLAAIAANSRASSVSISAPSAQQRRF